MALIGSASLGVNAMQCSANDNTDNTSMSVDDERHDRHTGSLVCIASASLIQCVRRLHVCVCLYFCPLLSWVCLLLFHLVCVHLWSQIIEYLLIYMIILCIRLSSQCLSFV